MRYRFAGASATPALQLIEDIDEAAEALAEGRREADGHFPIPMPERWREVPATAL